MRIPLLLLISFCSAVGIGLIAGFTRGLLSKGRPIWQLSLALAIPCLLGVAGAYEGSSNSDEHISVLLFAIVASLMAAMLFALSAFLGLLLAIPFHRTKAQPNVIRRPGR